MAPPNRGKSEDVDPKPRDLGVTRLKPYESEVEDRTGAMLRNVWMSRVL